MFHNANAQQSLAYDIGSSDEHTRYQIYIDFRPYGVIFPIRWIRCNVRLSIFTLTRSRVIKNRIVKQSEDEKLALILEIFRKACCCIASLFHYRQLHRSA